MGAEVLNDKSDILIRSYGRKRGKVLRSHRATALETVLPRITVVLPEKGVLDPAGLFDFPVRQVWLEIGFGSGEHLLHQAQQNPDIGMIGCEPFVNGVAALCRDLEKQQVKTIRIFPDDARTLMAKIAPHSLQKIFILNSDPWPKARHHKRRFIQTETLDDLHGLLVRGGLLRMSTDHTDLATWLIDKTYHHPKFQWTATCAGDWKNRPADMPETRYQHKGMTQGRDTVFLDFQAV